MSWICTVKLDGGRIVGTELETNFNKRFAHDKVRVDIECGSAVVDGVLLNKAEMEEEYGKPLREIVTSELIGMTSKDDALDFAGKLRGPFTGVFTTGSGTVAFGNQTGDTAVFYYYNSAEFIVASDFNELVARVKQGGNSLTFDSIYANHMMSFGFAEEGHTVAAEIKRVMPGCYVSIENGEPVVGVYHRFTCSTRAIDMDSAVEELDVAFRKAVKRCFDKDLEYGYKRHLADMSGGMDSRMTSWVAHDMGYSPITNIEYAKSDSDEREYGSRVAAALGNDYVFQPLDDLAYVYDIDELTRMSYGLHTYCGSSGSKGILSGVDWEVYGLEHTGQVGDAVIGSCCGSSREYSDKAFRNFLACDIVKPIIANKHEYDNIELMFLYYRAFAGVLGSHFVRRHYTESVSPYIDVDFLQFCLNLPLEYRSDHELYFKWVETKYPAALDIPSTRKRNEDKSLSARNLYHAAPTWMRHIANRACRLLHISAPISAKNTMLPMDYWYNHNPQLREFIDSYYQAHIGEVRTDEVTLKDLKRVFAYKGRVSYKLLVLTVLAANHEYIAG